MKIFGLGLPEMIILVILPIVFLIVFSCLAIIPARIAKNKGYKFWQFWLFGLFLFVPALIVAFLIQDKVTPTYSPAEELGKYKELLDRGAITQSEYELKKKELLALRDPFALMDNAV